MAIQKINLGTEPLGEGGDTYRSANTKINENFTNTAHAASRLVGSANGQIPLSEDTFKASSQLRADMTHYGKSTGDCDTFEVGTKYLVTTGTANVPPTNGVYLGTAYIVSTFTSAANNKHQVAVSYMSRISTVYYRNTQENGTYNSWTLASQSPQVYLTTTATAPNMVVDANGAYSRASSSLKYKDVIAKLELDNDLYDKAMQLKPIIYRSKSEIDPKDWHFMSFLAEEVGELDPALTQWKTHEYNDKGEKVELEKKEAEGINLNAICAVLHATNIYQNKKLKELEQRLTALESSLPKETK